MSQAIMIQGTASNVGKSMLATALCRIFAQRGFRTAPFKSWNMGLNSAVTPQGGEIGRAQAVQAKAAGIEPTVDMQPMLIKPKGDGKSQVIVRGRPIGDFGLDRKTDDYINWALETIDQSLISLAEEFEVLVLEGAGSPAEINIKDRDLANMKVASLHDTPVLLVADVDRGGALASVVGTLKLLPKEERRLVKGIVLNKFRGDYEILKPGLETIEEKTGKPVLGVIPYFKDFKIPDEDSASLSGFKTEEAEIKIGVVKLPHISNFTDFDALALESKVGVEYITSKDSKKLSSYEAVIIPGTKNTTADLNYLKESGLADELKRISAEDTPLVGICGGYQMLGEKLYDPELKEGKEKELKGLGLLDIETTFLAEKQTYQAEAVIESKASFWAGLEGERISGYEIHMGRTKRGEKAEAMFRLVSRAKREVSIKEGAYSKEGLVWGTYLHGIFSNDNFRRRFINWLRDRKGLLPLKEDNLSHQEEMVKNFDQLAKLVEENINFKQVEEILAEGTISHGS